VKRTPLRRLTRLASRTPIRRHRTTPRDRGGLADPAYLAYLRDQHCRVPGCPHRSVAHHLRHDEHGAAIGGRIKDDCRAISLCRLHHTGDLGIHTAPWKLRELLGCDDLQVWQDAMLAEQREIYLRGGADFEAMAF
jgi:hypothetical protein